MNYRQTRNGYLNCNVRMYEGVGAYDVPEIAPVDVDLTGAALIDFSHALKTSEPEKKICHFFTDDYEFERCWREPRRYVENLRRFRAVIGPDFSSYTDFPWACQVFNHYRRQWLERFWQDEGVAIIPDVQFGYDDDGASFLYCLDGIPHGGMIATSTIGGLKNKRMREMWLERWRDVVEILRPRRVLLVGKMFEGIELPDGEIINLESNTIANKEAARDARIQTRKMDAGANRAEGQAL